MARIAQGFDQFAVFDQALGIVVNDDNVALRGGDLTTFDIRQFCKHGRSLFLASCDTGCGPAVPLAQVPLIPAVNYHKNESYSGCK